MNNFLDKPEDFYHEVRRYTASVITSLVFGWRAPSYDSYWSKVSMPTNLIRGDTKDWSRVLMMYWKRYSLNYLAKSCDMTDVVYI
jgi:hypothetical protein